MLWRHWYDISAGAQNWHLSLTVNSYANELACSVYISRDKVLYKKFEAHRSDVEKRLGVELEWMELPNKKASRIKQSMSLDLDDDQAWPEYYAWLLDRATVFRKVFGEVKSNA